MNREAILERLGGDVSLPAMPEVLAKLDQFLRDPAVDVREVAKLVASDTVLAGQVLRMANSAYYSRGGAPVSAMQGAIQRMGLKALKGLVYALTLPRLFSGAAEGFPHKRMWRHSIAVAAFSGELSLLTDGNPMEREEAYLAGLIHDVGALVLWHICPREYGRFLAEQKVLTTSGDPPWDERDLAQRELDKFGIDHAEVGSIFLQERWRMPAPLPFVIRYHHGIDRDEIVDPRVQRLVDLVHVGNGICNCVGASWDPLSLEGGPFSEGAWESLGLTLDRVEFLVAKVRESLDQADSLLGMAGG